MYSTEDLSWERGEAEAGGLLQAGYETGGLDLEERRER